MFDRLGPYHMARLSAAARRFPVTAIEVAAQSTAYAWDPVEEEAPFDRHTLFQNCASDEIPTGALKQRVRDVLNGVAPDVVAIPGWATPAALSALHWCLVHKVPAVVMSETTPYDFTRHWWKEWPKQRLVQQFDAALVGGKDHQQYLEQLGMPSSAIAQGYDVVDNAHFARGAAQVKENLEAVREQFGLPPRYVLASARFIPKKNLPRLIAAYARYREAVEDPWDLVLLGDGPERPSVEAAVKREGVESHVQLPGFRQYDELPVYYGAAEAFVHASTTEQWGLVVNEAMAAGLPVGVSDRCGCAGELVRAGVNGWTFDPLSVKAIAHVLARLHAAVDRDDKMREDSLEIISKWGPDRFGEGLQTAVRAVQRQSVDGTSVLDRFLTWSLIHR
jgi:glycosyltransferase involved in cell wall biosynthesis